MALFGSSWLDEPIEDDGPMVGSNWRDETSFEYYQDHNGEYKQIRTKRELYDAIDDNNRFTFDGKEYSKKH